MLYVIDKKSITSDQVIPPDRKMLCARDWAPISLTIVVGTALGIAFTGTLAQALLRRSR